MRVAFLIILLSFFSNIAYAQNNDAGAFISGAYLHKLCEVDANGVELFKGARASCQSYIAGIIDYHKFLRSLGTAPSLDFCVPNTARLNDLQTVVWTYLDINTQHDEFNAAPAVTLALHQVFACPR